MGQLNHHIEFDNSAETHSSHFHRRIGMFVVCSLLLLCKHVHAVDDHELSKLAMKYSGLFASELPAQVFDETFTLRAHYSTVTPSYDDGTHEITIYSSELFIDDSFTLIPEICAVLKPGHSARYNFHYKRNQCDKFMLSVGHEQSGLNIPDHMSFLGSPQTFRDIKEHGLDAEFKIRLVRSSKSPVFMFQTSTRYATPILPEEKYLRIFLVTGVLEKVSLLPPVGEARVLFESRIELWRDASVNGSDKEAESGRQANQGVLNERRQQIGDWVRRIQAKIKNRILIPSNMTGNPEVRFDAVLLPGGEVLSATLKKSSNNRDYDAAVERAIIAAQPLPVPSDIDLFNDNFRNLTLVFRPKD